MSETAEDPPLTRPHPGSVLRPLLNPFDWYPASTLFLAGCLRDREDCRRANAVVDSRDFPCRLNGALFAAITAARQRHSVDQLEVTLLINPPFHRTVLLLYREVRAVPPAMVETIGMPTLVAALLYEEAAFVPRGDA